MEDERKTKKQLIEELNCLRLEKIDQTRVTSEKFTKAFLQNSIPITITTVKDGRFVEVSDAFLRLVERKRDEVIGHTSRETGFITEEQRTLFYNELGKHGHVENFEMEVRPKGRGSRYGLFNVVMMTINNESYLLTTIQDITERKQALHELETHQIELSMQNDELHRAQVEVETIRAKYFDLYDLAPVGYVTVSEQGLILETNLTAASLLGVAKNALVKSLLTRFIIKEDHNIYYLQRKQLFKTGKPQAYELRMMKNDGTAFWAMMKMTAAKGTDGAPTCRTVLSDITEWKKIEVALKESEERFRRMFLTHDAIMLLIDQETGSIRDANNAAEQFYGYSKDRLNQMTIQEINSLPAEEVALQRTLAMEQKRNYFIFPHRLANGEVKTVEVHSSPVTIRNDNLLFSIIHDITARKQAEDALEFSNIILRTQQESLNDGILVVDEKGEILSFNQRFVKMWGIPPDVAESKSDDRALQSVMDKLVSPEEFISKVKYLYGVRDEISLDEIILKDGRIFDRYSAPMIGAERKYYGRVWNFRDITERKQVEAEKDKLEAQNRQLQKTESLGRMAASIAHHFNNQLGAVIGYLEIAMDELPKGASTHQTLTKVMQSAWTAADMSGLMLTYLGQTHEKVEPLDLSYSCRKILPLIKIALPANVVMETDFPTPRPIIMANIGEIQQILTNLITNASEAIGNKSGTISLSVKTFSPAEIPEVHRFPINWQPQDKTYACLGVADTGSGIQYKAIEQLFDPFFSTRFTGRGMGLAVVLGLVTSYKGVITLDSNPGRGSTFRIFFPLSEESLPQIQIAENSGEITIGKSTPGKFEECGTVLLIEDEEPLRKMVAIMLERMGFSVLEGKDGIEALEIFGKHQSEIKFVLTDLTMPRMGGWETLTALRKLQPNIPVILASGYDLAHVMEGDHPELPQAFLGKPYNLKGLSDAIRQALESRGAEGHVP